MNFDLGEEHRLVEQSTREWAAREVSPRIQQLDREHTFDRGLLPKMAELGLLGICVPAKYGGAGMDYISLGVACEELEYADTSMRVILSVHVALNCLTLLTWGTEAQKQKYLVPQAQGTLHRHLRSHRAVGGQRCARHSDDRREARRSVRVERREDVDLAGRRGRHVSGDRLDRSRRKSGRRIRRA